MLNNVSSLFIELGKQVSLQHRTASAGQQSIKILHQHKASISTEDEHTLGVLGREVLWL